MTAPRPWIRRVDDPFDGVDRVCYESDTSAAILPVSATLACLYLAFAALHHAVGQAPGLVMDVVAVLSSLVAVGVALTAWQHRIPEHLAHAVMTLLVGVTTLNAMLHLLTTRDPEETIGFLFLLVGVGVVLLRRGYLVPSVLAVWVAWTAAVSWIGGGPEVWGRWVVYMLMATALGAVAVLLRRRSVDVASTALREALRAATEDPVTRLANRRGLSMLSREIMELGRRRGEIVHCTFLDVDGLKQVNDELGHDAGDRVILAVAHAVRASCRSSDVVARWGGDEFVVVGLGSGDASREIERRVLRSLVEEHPDDPVLSALSISAGRSELAPWEPGDVETLLWKADHDMYQRRAARPRKVRRVFLPDAAEPFEP